MAEFDNQGFITALAPNEVLIVGTNLNGNHYGGAARQAHEQFGLGWGVGEGISGQSYAFPTLDEQIRPVSSTVLKMARLNLYKTAQAHPDLTFYLTKVGCGIAGFDERRMRKLFTNPQPNIIKPVDWR